MPDLSLPVLLLAIDTCGPTGSVALGRWDGGVVEVLGQIELEGRNYSSTLVTAFGEVLALGGVALRQLGAIIVVHGPGSFTGVRVGLAAVKGLAEAAQLPVLAVSRLEVLAAKAGCLSAVLDAHRHEVYLRICEESWVPQVPILGPGNPPSSTGQSYRELLAGAHELADLVCGPSRVALCDEAAALLLASACPEAELVRTDAPTAADALRFGAPRVEAGEFADLALLDGHYLRRSDAEIFGEPVAATAERR
ncbi:MAG: tRNA (adenosine(37)-N6)-threonylcarbamoyltransferase complex dimerization subunit type 1 TsaB [Terracidiphilus sp.]